jgi:Ca-activated chloride channel homolog
VWSLEEPAALFLVLLVPALAWLVHFRKARGSKVPFGFGIWRGVSLSAAVRGSKAAAAVPWVLFWAGFVSLVIALAGPVALTREEVNLGKGVDMVIALDQSPSMTAEDFKPVNRFECAKQVIRRFVAGRDNDQVGLVTFASQAVLRVPPTIDHEVLLDTLSDLDIMDMELGDGTAIGMGIATAALHLKSGKSKSKVIILLTDGVNNSGDVQPEDAVYAAADLGIRIYTVGIGRYSEGSWVIVNRKTGQEYLATSGEFDEKLLIRIATASGGKYYSALDPDALTRIFGEIDSMEKTEKRVRIYVEKSERYGMFAAAGLAFILLSLCIRKLALREIV